MYMKECFERFNEEQFGNLLWAAQQNADILCGDDANAWIVSGVK